TRPARSRGGAVSVVGTPSTKAPGAVSASSVPPVAPLPITTKAPTPSQILLFVLMSKSRRAGDPHGALDKARLTYYRGSDRSSHLVVLNGSNSSWQQARKPDADRDRRCPFGRGDRDHRGYARARALHRWPRLGGLRRAACKAQRAGRGLGPLARDDP